MSSIPLDLERRFEQRWAARFVRQAPERSSEKSGPSNTIENKLAPTSTATNRLSRIIPNSIGITTGTLCVSLAQAKMTQPQMRKPSQG
jgi:hypothetical protein